MRSNRLHVFLAAAAMLGLTLADAVLLPARADDCQGDIANFNKKRQGAIEQLNALAKGGKKQLDPIAACPRLKNLVAIERQLVAYLTKNKDWCNVPDDALANISASASKSATLQTQACNVAAQVKKMQSQQASGLNVPQGQKLPTGPL